MLLKRLSNRCFVTGFTICVLLALSSGCAGVDPLLNKGKYDEAEEYCTNEEVEKQVGCWIKMADAYALEAETGIAKADYRSAEEYYIKAKDIYEKIGYVTEVDMCDKKLADAYLSEAQANLDMAEYTATEDYYLKAMGIYENIGHEDKVKECNQGLANMSFLMGNLDDSVKYYIKAGHAKKETNKIIADRLKTDSRYTEAAAYYLAAKEVKKARSCYRKVADQYFNKKDIEKAINYYVKSGLNIKGAYLLMAEKYLAKNRYAKAIKYYNKAGRGKKARSTELKRLYSLIDKGEDKKLLSFLYRFLKKYPTAKVINRETVLHVLESIAIRKSFEMPFEGIRGDDIAKARGDIGKLADYYCNDKLLPKHSRETVLTNEIGFLYGRAIREKTIEELVKKSNSTKYKVMFSSEFKKKDAVIRELMLSFVKEAISNLKDKNLDSKSRTQTWKFLGRLLGRGAYYPNEGIEGSKEIVDKINAANKKEKSITVRKSTDKVMKRMNELIRQRRKK